mmetsp:Transcript_12939/g.39825  ORF Transcript_12939/g.39825 Transcript_12939/m.39825 type:complete len:92 (-) Transcript_12939:1442-1717(-)
MLRKRSNKFWIATRMPSTRRFRAEKRHLYQLTGASSPSSLITGGATVANQGVKRSTASVITLAFYVERNANVKGVKTAEMQTKQAPRGPTK